MLPETDADAVLRAIETTAPKLAIVDSIQTMYDAGLEAAAGTVSQVRECAARLQRLAKASATTIFLVGHVTKEGSLAGPRVLEHMVDTVLYLEGDRHQEFRILRATKNRFGSTDEIGIFSMGEAGLEEVADPSAALLGENSLNSSGTVVLAAVEGTRPLLVELQSLVTDSPYDVPRSSTASRSATSRRRSPSHSHQISSRHPGFISNRRKTSYAAFRSLGPLGGDWARSGRRLHPGLFLGAHRRGHTPRQRRHHQPDHPRGPDLRLPRRSLRPGGLAQRQLHAAHYAPARSHHRPLRPLRGPAGRGPDRFLRARFSVRRVLERGARRAARLPRRQRRLDATRRAPRLDGLGPFRDSRAAGEVRHPGHLGHHRRPRRRPGAHRVFGYAPDRSPLRSERAAAGGRLLRQRQAEPGPAWPRSADPASERARPRHRIPRRRSGRRAGG